MVHQEKVLVVTNTKLHNPYKIYDILNIPFLNNSSFIHIISP